MPWGTILREKAVWAIAIAHLCTNFRFYILLLWLPTYLDKTFAMALPRMGLFSLIPWISTFISSNLTAIDANQIKNSGFRVVTVRKTLQSVWFIGGALPLSLLPSVSTPIKAIILMTISITCNGFATSAFTADPSRHRAPLRRILMGISNTVATIPGIIGVAAAGFVLRATSSLSAVFLCDHCGLLHGRVAAHLWPPATRSCNEIPSVKNQAGNAPPQPAL